MRWVLAGGISSLFAAALFVNAVAQERPGRSRNQSLEEQLKPYDVFTTQSSKPSVLEAPARSEIQRRIRGEERTSSHDHSRSWLQ